ncbi:MAG: hypothetical protein HN389_02875 [Clostridia bacterium]|jgi:two-component system, OmpR family, phosphate regulon sensor histidine kinase PhoR|nr:hypothetical protein [Clostridia bacterium]
MNSIYKKIAFKITILFLCILIVAATGAVFHFNYVYRQDTEDNLTRETKMISRLIQSSDDLASLTDYIDSSGDLRFTIIDLSGSVIINTEGYPVEKLDFLSKPEIIDAIELGNGTNTRFVEPMQEARMYVAVLSTKDYIIRTSAHMRGFQFLAMSVLLPFFIIIIFAVLMCLVVALFVSRSITNPIIKLTNDAMRVSTGDTNDIALDYTGDEFQSLSLAIKNMVSKQNSNIKDLAEKNSQLNAVLEAIPGGVLTFDVDEFVTLANPAAIEMFLFRERGKNDKTLDMQKYAGLKSIVRKAMFASGVVRDEITIEGKSKNILLRVYAVPVHNEGVLYGVIILAEDITQIRRLENMQTVFIANVSHELLTPLTVISGFIETLRTEKVPKDDAYRFLDIIAQESSRLSKLIDEILVLSKLEQESFVASSTLDIRFEVESSVKLLKIEADKKNIDITISVPSEEVLVVTKISRIDQMMINLLSNAIKYNKENGKIIVSLTKKDNKAIITIEDTGIGIGKEDIPRLFERFYRVDKSRTRALGGTGLGLSIVNHIVNIQNGEIDVESKLGVGTKFTITLPLATIS